MIYSDDFVWLHYPKCAGTLIETLFKKYYSDQSDIVQDFISFNLFGISFNPFGTKRNPLGSWHDSVLQREARDTSFQLENRVVICSFRRLPSWLESRYNYEFKRNPKLDHCPERLLEGKFLEHNGFENHADMYAMKFFPKSIMESGRLRFIRTEFFETDFKAAFGEFIDVKMIPDSEFNKKINSSKSWLPPDFRKKFYADQQRLYENCPYWKSVEEIAYGNIAM